MEFVLRKGWNSPKDAQAFILGKIKEFDIVLPPPKKIRFEGKIFFIVRILC